MHNRIEMERRHTDRDYDGELAELREQLLMMGARVEEMLAGSLRAFTERDSRVAENTIALDEEIDRLEVEIDARCLRILARWNPMASDLRFITTVLKLVTHLERIGDLAENICRRAMELNCEAVITVGPALVRLAQAAPEMVRDALDAFVARDVHRAQNVILRDQSVDAYYAQCFPELMQLMMLNPERIAGATRLQAIGKAYERIGDQATNIAEMVPFMVEGKNVRHPHLRALPGEAMSGVFRVSR
jgi:phosphate transport system protein